jgi:adenylate cyclase
VVKAVECFRQAVRLDSRYPLPHEGIANCYLVLLFFSVGQPRPLLEQAKSPAARAVELDPLNASARATMALARGWADWDWTQASSEIEMALHLDANDFQVHDWGAFVFASQGRTSEAVRQIGQALELDPLALHLQHHAAWSFLLNRQFDRALEQAHRMVELDASYPLAYFWMGAALEALSRYSEAEAAFRKTLELLGGGDLPPFESFLGHCLGISGRQAEARQILEKLEALSTRAYVEPYGIGLIHLGLGELDNALSRMEQAVEIRSAWSSVFLASDYRLDPLRPDPRFRQLLIRMGTV